MNYLTGIDYYYLTESLEHRFRMLKAMQKRLQTCPL